jgi:hypothetical protein
MPKPRRRIRLRATALVAMAIALPALAQGDALSRLRQGHELACEPDYPVFCANVHVTCTGHTRITAHGFRVSVRGESASVSAAPEADPVRQPYERARVVWGDAPADLIVQPASGPGYLRIDAAGRYSWRHYVGPTGVMSIGSCR